MFTGIIEAVGEIRGIQAFGSDKRFRIELGALAGQAIALGDSVAVNGVCLTVVEFDARSFAADVSVETLSCTTLGDVRSGQAVNLERAVTPSTRLGGHIVSGHVDGIATVAGRKPDARSVRFQFELPFALARYVAAKGAICINGISLTVNEVAGNTFGVNIVPHTLANTTLDRISVGDRVNIEVDMIARYLERLLQGSTQTTPSALTPEYLAEHGFWK